MLNTGQKQFLLTNGNRKRKTRQNGVIIQVFHCVINGCNRLILAIIYTFHNYFKRARVRGVDMVREDTFIAAVL